MPVPFEVVTKNLEKEVLRDYLLLWNGSAVARKYNLNPFNTLRYIARQIHGLNGCGIFSAIGQAADFNSRFTSLISRSGATGLTRKVSRWTYSSVGNNSA
jgi:hypothetical protein